MADQNPQVSSFPFSQEVVTAYLRLERVVEEVTKKKYTLSAVVGLEGKVAAVSRIPLSTVFSFNLPESFVNWLYDNRHIHVSVLLDVEKYVQSGQKNLTYDISKEKYRGLAEKIRERAIE